MEGEGCTNERVCQRLVHNLLQLHMHPVYSSLTSGKPDRLTAAALQLLTAAVMQGPSVSRDLQLLFNFSYKPVRLLHMRSKKLQGPFATLCYTSIIKIISLSLSLSLSLSSLYDYFLELVVTIVYWVILGE